MDLCFFVPNTETPSSDLVVTVNGTEIDTSNIEELNWGSSGSGYTGSGDLEYDYVEASHVFEAKEKVIEEATDEEETEEETKLKNPKTGDTMVKTAIISLISVLGIAFTVNSIKKQNK